MILKAKNEYVVILKNKSAYTIKKDETIDRSELENTSKNLLLIRGGAFEILEDKKEEVVLEDKKEEVTSQDKKEEEVLEDKKEEEVSASKDFNKKNKSK